MPTNCVGHYSSLDALSTILQEDYLTLWATRYGYLADKKEFVWARDAISKILPETAQKLGLEYDENYKVHPYILSLTNALDDRYMWQHYGNNCKGAMLILDRVSIFDHCNTYSEKTSTFRTCMDVVYSSDKNLPENVLKT